MEWDLLTTCEGSEPETVHQGNLRFMIRCIILWKTFIILPCCLCISQTYRMKSTAVKCQNFFIMLNVLHWLIRFFAMHGAFWGDFRDCTSGGAILEQCTREVWFAAVWDKSKHEWSVIFNNCSYREFPFKPNVSTAYPSSWNRPTFHLWIKLTMKMCVIIKIHSWWVCAQHDHSNQ